MGQLSVADPPQNAEATGSDKQDLSPAGVDAYQSDKSDGNSAAQHS